MPAVNILKFPVASPADTSPLDELKRAGYDRSQILGVVGKSEGQICSRCVYVFESLSVLC